MATVWKLKTKYGGLRIREDRLVTSAEIGKVLVSGTELVATRKYVYTSSGANYSVNDTWYFVTFGNVSGWVAGIHLGVHYCKDVVETVIDDVVENDPPPFVILELPSGKKTKYVLSAE